MVFYERLGAFICFLSGFAFTFESPSTPQHSASLTFRYIVHFQIQVRNIKYNSNEHIRGIAKAATCNSLYRLKDILLLRDVQSSGKNSAWKSREAYNGGETFYMQPVWQEF